MEPDSIIKIENFETYSTQDDLYCRCCFKISNLFDLKPLSSEIISAIKDFIYKEINFSEGSRFVCEECHEIIQTLVKYQNEIYLKQVQFSILVSNNEHRDISKIQGI